MPTATERKKAKTIEGPTPVPVEEKDFDAGICETTDLKSEREQIENLKSKIQRLQEDFNQRQTNLEVNLRQLRQQRDEKVAGLRSKYDACLDRGDSNGTAQCLDEIRKAHEDLTNLARKAMGADKDFSDLKIRGNELHLAAGSLYKMTLANFQQAKTLMEQAAGLTSAVTYSIGRDVLKLESIIKETTKISEVILAE